MASLADEKKAVAEIRSYTSPPPAVLTTMTPICLLFRAVGDTYTPADPRIPGPEELPNWREAKLLLTSEGFFPSLLAVNKDTIPDATLAAMQASIPPDFDPEAVREASAAAGQLAKWVLALCEYAQLRLEQRPLRRRVRKAKGQVGNAVQREGDAGAGPGWRPR